MAFPNYDNPVLQYRDLRRLAVASALFAVRQAFQNVDLSEIKPKKTREALEELQARMEVQLVLDQDAVASAANITPEVWSGE